MKVFRKIPGFDSTGDAIPMFHNGEYHIFSLTPPIGTTVYPERLRTSYAHAVSKNLIDWEILPTALFPGEGEDEPDACGVWTGSALYAEGEFHILYTGYNYRTHFSQTICHATSTDGITWEKDPGNPIILPDEELYEVGDWRDPFVFYHEEEQRYWILISARIKTGPPQRRGCIVLYTSEDLKTYDYYGPLYTPFHTNCPECCDLFKMGKYWYLSYSRFSEFGNTIYRYSESPYGPWKTPASDGIGSRRFYAGKSLLNDEGRRLYFAWSHDRGDKSDTGEWYWGGEFCIPHEVYPSGNGDLNVKLPEEFVEAMVHDTPSDFIPMHGDITCDDQGVFLNSPGTFSYGFFDIQKEQFLFTCSLKSEETHDSFGIVLKSDQDCAQCLLLLFEVGMQRVSLLNLPMAVDPFWEASCTNIGQPKQPGPDGVRVAERPFQFTAGDVIDIKIFIDHDLIEIFAGEKAAFTYRYYGKTDYQIGLFAQDGIVKIGSPRFLT